MNHIYSATSIGGKKMQCEFSRIWKRYSSKSIEPRRVLGERRAQRLALVIKPYTNSKKTRLFSVAMYSINAFEDGDA